MECKDVMLIERINDFDILVVDIWSFTLNKNREIVERVLQINECPFVIIPDTFIFSMRFKEKEKRETMYKEYQEKLKLFFNEFGYEVLNFCILNNKQGTYYLLKRVKDVL